MIKYCMSRRLVPVEARFWSKVDIRGNDECWPWTACVDKKGYGRFGLVPGVLEMTRSRSVLAHRVAFRLIQGHWPEPDALHGCDNPPCCNALSAAHVHEGTPADNCHEMDLRGRRACGFHRPNQVGAANHRAILSDDQVALLCARWATGGITQTALAAEFAVTPGYVSRLVRGQLRRGGG
jgi:hypothetical protein